MSLNADTLLDRIYLKAQVRKWRIIGILCIFVSIIVWLPEIGTKLHLDPIRSNFIARITIDTIITDDKKLFELIESARTNPKIKAVVVWLDTPGGSAIGGQELYLKLKELSHSKPVVAVVRSMAASAGYMAAIGTDYIVAREGSITGSIGVIVQTGEVTGLAEKLGIKPISIKSAPLKASPSPFEKLTPEAEAVIQNVINDFYSYFIGIVEERRKLTHEEALFVSDGRVFSGKEALRLKLIDELGGEKEAVQWLAKKKNIDASLEVEDIEVKKENQELIDLLGGSAANSVLYNLLVKLDGLVSIWHPNIL